VQTLAATVENRRLITYGTNPQAEVRATKIKMGPDGARFDVEIAIRGQEPATLKDMHLPMAGLHNVLNSLAAIAVSRELGVTDDKLKKGLAGFGGVKRRFTTTGVSHGIRVVDDYGHHPVEISSVLAAARAVTERKVIAVVQPHRYTRLRDLFADFCTCFNDADEVIVADVYTAGEAPIEGIDRDHLVEGLKRSGHRHALALEAVADLPHIIARDAEAGDVVVLLGAGDITAWAYALPAQLDELKK
jgi:UDP-N-acetylmuramate--alanine ligase